MSYQAQELKRQESASYVWDMADARYWKWKRKVLSGTVLSGQMTRPAVSKCWRKNGLWKNGCPLFV